MVQSSQVAAAKAKTLPSAWGRFPVAPTKAETEAAAELAGQARDSARRFVSVLLWPDGSSGFGRS